MLSSFLFVFRKYADFIKNILAISDKGIIITEKDKYRNRYKFGCVKFPFFL